MIASSVISPGLKSEFDEFEKKSDVFKNSRLDAFEVFNRLGFPSTKHEEWKYTNLKNIITQPLDFSKQHTASTLTLAEIDQFRIAGKVALLLVFENGKFLPELSDPVQQKTGITIGNLGAFMESGAAQNYLGKVAQFQTESFVALNTAFLDEGLFVHVLQGIEMEQAVHFLHINSSVNPAAITNIRNLIVAEKGSKISIIETYVSRNSECKGIINAVTEIVVKEHAFVEHVKAQLDADQSSQVNFTQVNQDNDSTFDTVTVTLSGLLVRNNLHICLNGVNCTSHLFGLYILDEVQVVDNHTLVDHAMPHCFSNELYKGIIGGKASGVFNGKIFVRKDAQKTNAYQSNKNILLTDDAQMNTKPQLEIFADDVKCTHGATTGQMDEEALFYLRARGIGEQSAKALLNIAFAGDVLNNIKNEELKENLFNLAVEKLHKNEY